MKINYLIIILLNFPLLIKGQDTIFVNKHHFNSPVRNVFLGKDGIFVKTGTTLYKRVGNEWEQVKSEFKKSYVFFDKEFYETDYLPTQMTFNPSNMERIIPQISLANPSKANFQDQLFVSVGGSLFEYKISPFYKITYKNCSIRDIYIEKGLTVLSTYSGIFINDSIKVLDPGYSSGAFNKINNQYFLCSDNLYQFDGLRSFKMIDSTDKSIVGYYRKMIQLNGKLFSLNTKSINIYDSLGDLKPIHQGFEYQDMIDIKDSLFFSTSSGEVFRWFNGRTMQLFNLGTRIRGIYHFKNTSYFSSDKGLFTLEHGFVPSLKKLLDLPNVLNVRVDVNNNTWISTENGLYLLPERSITPIPFIPNVEFNRGAINLYDNKLYVGSIAGLYEIDCYATLRGFIPQYLNKKQLYQGNNYNNLILYGFGFLLILIISIVFYYKRKRKIPISEILTSTKSFSLETIKSDIIEHDIMTVDGLAEFYKTNTVQLNRDFKKFDTTPGKFLKNVKMQLAEELVKKGESMELIVAKTGYTAQYIKKNVGNI